MSDFTCKGSRSILNYVWSKQRSFNENFVDFSSMTIEDKQRMTKEYVIHLLSESNDLLNEVNWKIHHKFDNIRINRRELILEWIDVFKYWLSIGLLWDFTPEEFLKYFTEKSDLVEQRFLQEYSDLSDKKVLVCDIDGVLSDYPRTFLEYVSSQENNASINDKKVTYIDLYRLLEGEVTTERLKQYKHQYRSDGLIRNEKVTKGSAEFLKFFKSLGYYIVILTSRPFDTYKNLYLDTFYWLKNNGLTFDMLLSDSKKRDKIIKILESSRVEFIVDDDPKIIKSLIGIDNLNKLYMINKTYNSNEHSPKVTRVNGFEDIIRSEGLSEKYDEWRKSNE